MREDGSAVNTLASDNPQYDLRHCLVEIAAAFPFWGMFPMATVLG